VGQVPRQWQPYLPLFFGMASDAGWLVNLCLLSELKLNKNNLYASNGLKDTGARGPTEKK
jgi:hypothetical protein